MAGEQIEVEIIEGVEHITVHLLEHGDVSPAQQAAIHAGDAASLATLRGEYGDADAEFISAFESALS